MAFALLHITFCTPLCAGSFADVAVLSFAAFQSGLPCSPAARTLVYGVGGPRVENATFIDWGWEGRSRCPSGGGTRWNGSQPFLYNFLSEAERAAMPPRPPSRREALPQRGAEPGAKFRLHLPTGRLQVALPLLPSTHKGEEDC
ncbi:hypothetical protein Anapl_02461 [Anas platyrhynchos]|uniref:Uncharacterized protein n=1 Tax=Anas platyrhynchos TaxID=8839 RepID=R0LPJ8_ANAPL|nr:hypothetical protein Anapl_02461 [Anas platyrhynchos]